MKTFASLREQKTTSKKIGQYNVSFRPVKNGVEAVIDGSVLDVYKDENQAEKFVKEFIKQLEGLK